MERSHPMSCPWPSISRSSAPLAESSAADTASR
jgi:hypothetical protein